jgi:hypothetical protein
MSAAPPSGPEIATQVQVQIDWSVAEKLPVMAANVFFIQQTGQEFIITVGFTSPPMVQGPLTAEQAKALKLTPQPIVKFAMPASRVVELLQLLNQQIALYRQTEKQ